MLHAVSHIYLSSSPFCRRAHRAYRGEDLVQAYLLSKWQSQCSSPSAIWKLLLWIPPVYFLHTPSLQSCSSLTPRVLDSSYLCLCHRSVKTLFANCKIVFRFPVVLNAFPIMWLWIYLVEHISLWRHLCVLRCWCIPVLITAAMHCYMTCLDGFSSFTTWSPFFWFHPMSLEIVIGLILCNQT